MVPTTLACARSVQVCASLPYARSPSSVHSLSPSGISSSVSISGYIFKYFCSQVSSTDLNLALIFYNFVIVHMPDQNEDSKNRIIADKLLLTSSIKP